MTSASGSRDVDRSAIKNQSRPKPITRVFLKTAAAIEANDEKSDKSETRPETRIICRCKRIEVVVGGETARPEERLQVEQRHVRLRDQVIVRVRCAGDPVPRRHVLHKQQHRAANHKRYDDFREYAVAASLWTAMFGKQPINREQHGEDRRRRLGQDRDRCRKNVEIIPAQLREGEVNRKRRDNAERRDYFGRCDDVVDACRRLPDATRTTRQRRARSSRFGDDGVRFRAGDE